jgi:hypothetical protein
MTTTMQANWELTTAEIQERVTRATTERDGFIPLKVHAFLEHVGAKDANGWAHDKWTITLSRGDKHMTFDYRTGIGHRRVPLRTFTAGKFTTAEKSRPERKGDRGLAIPCVPSAYDVLSSVLSDASAENENFIDWCDNLGFDTDSRKAVDMYEACVRMGRDARRVLGDLYAQFDGCGF